MESGNDRIEFVYDYMGRRVVKKVYTGSTGNWTLNSEKMLIYDKWNLIEEITRTYSGGSIASSESDYYVWGFDASQTLTGAGGVGGLLAVDNGAEMFYPTYDANGNVSEYIDEAENVVAHYEYSPFGKVTVETGSKADNFNFRFSTKYAVDLINNQQSEISNLYYYGYRHYNAETGAWLSRDPIEEQGGLNLYGFVGNNVVNSWDYLGLDHRIGPISNGGKGTPQCPNELGQAINAAWELLKAYKAMRDANVIGADKYFHCIGMCKASREYKKGFATAIGVIRELTDLGRKACGDNGASANDVMDSLSDMLANLTGINCPHEKSCECCCCKYKVNGL